MPSSRFKIKIEEETMIKTCWSSLCEFGVQDLVFLVLHCGILCKSAGFWMWGCVGCVFCVLAATWVWSGNYCFNRGRRYLRKMQRKSGRTKLTTSCQWKKMVSPILSIIFLVEVATLQSCSIHFLARSVATLLKKWTKVVDLLWSFCFFCKKILHTCFHDDEDWLGPLDCCE